MCLCVGLGANRITPATRGGHGQVMWHRYRTVSTSTSAYGTCTAPATIVETHAVRAALRISHKVEHKADRTFKKYGGSVFLAYAHGACQPQGRRHRAAPVAHEHRVSRYSVVCLYRVCGPVCVGPYRVLKVAVCVSTKKKSDKRNGRNGQTCEKSTLGECWEMFSESRA